MRELQEFEMDIVAGGDNYVDEVIVTGSGGSFYWDIKPMGLVGSTGNPLLTYTADGETGLTGYDMLWAAAKLVFGEEIGIFERNISSQYNHDNINQDATTTHNWYNTFGGITYVTQFEARYENNGTWWYDLDGNGKFETHLKLYDDGKIMYDSNSDGSFDRAFTHKSYGGFGS